MKVFNWLAFSPFLVDPFQHPFVPQVPLQSLLSATNARPALMIPPWVSSLHPIHESAPGYIYRPENMCAFHVVHGRLFHLPQQPGMPYNYPSTSEYMAPANQTHVQKKNLKPFGEQLSHGSKPQEAAHLLLSAPHIASSKQKKATPATLNSNPYGQLLPLTSMQMVRTQPPHLIQAWNDCTQGQQIPLNSGNGVYIYNQPMLGQQVPRHKSPLLQPSIVVPPTMDIRGYTAAVQTAPHNAMVHVLNEIQQTKSQKPSSQHVTYLPIASATGLRTEGQGETGLKSKYYAMERECKWRDMDGHKDGNQY